MKLFTTVCLFILIQVFRCGCDDTYSKSQLLVIELKPLIISTKLGGTVEFPIPKPKDIRTLVHTSLYRTNGTEIKIHNNPNIFWNKQNLTDEVRLKPNAEVKRYKNDNELIESNLMPSNYKLKHNYYYKETRIDEKRKGNYCFEGKHECEEDMIELGPLSEDDHGNWVIVSELKNPNDTITDMFRVITIEIIEKVPTDPQQIKLSIGDTYKLKLKDKVANLESCEIIAPRTTFDRFYERDTDNMDSCGYIIRNLTSEDQGIWKIVAVGKIVYEGLGNLITFNKVS